MLVTFITSLNQFQCHFLFGNSQILFLPSKSLIASRQHVLETVFQNGSLEFAGFEPIADGQHTARCAKGTSNDNQRKSRLVRHYFQSKFSQQETNTETKCYNTPKIEPLWHNTQVCGNSMSKEPGFNIYGSVQVVPPCVFESGLPLTVSLPARKIYLDDGTFTYKVQ